MRFLLLLLFVGFALSADQHATATVRLNKSLFELASKKVKPLIDKLVAEVDIPLINVTSGDVWFYTRSINLTDFDFPMTTFTISPEGLTWNTLGGKIGIRMHFVARWNGPLGVKITKTGFANVTVEDLRTNINALIKSVDSRPELYTNSCYTNVDQLDVVFEAGIPGDIINILRPLILNYIKKWIIEDACNLISNLREQGNKWVRKQPEEIRVWRNIYLNYTADKDPIYHDDYIEAECSFRVAVRDNKTAVLAMDYDEDAFISAILDSMNSKDAKFTPVVAAAPGHFPANVLLYALAAYGVFSIVEELLKAIVRRRKCSMTPLKMTSSEAKAYENEALAASDLYQ